MFGEARFKPRPPGGIHMDWSHQWDDEVLRSGKLPQESVDRYENDPEYRARVDALVQEGLAELGLTKEP